MMKQCALLLLACVYAHAVPLEAGTKPGSCQDAVALGAAGQALDKINKDRTEGYVFGLHRLSNVNQMEHGETGVVFYLTMDVLETDCHVVSKKNAKDCVVPKAENTPVYGQCKAVIYMNRVHRVVRLYNYNCVVRPAAAAKVAKQCPDCPSAMPKDHQEILKTATLSMEKFNKDSGLANHFAILNITRARTSMGMATFYFAEFTIQETTCANTTDPSAASKCPLMDCEFAHKGHCKGSHSHGMEGQEVVTVNCEVFENENSKKEKAAHLLGGETDHSHTLQSGKHGKDHTHDASGAHDHAHDHDHDHTKDHAHNHAHNHTKDHKHDGAHDHKDGAHGRSHGDRAAGGHDHAHAHHAKAHNHSTDTGPHQHHNYKHDGEGHTHEHDHELALDHDHKHAHLHEHEHHHHHHEHPHGTKSTHPPQGTVTVLPALGLPMTLPSFPEQPVGKKGATLPMVQDPNIPGMSQPTILPFPTTVSAQCPLEVKDEDNFVKELFAEDPLFKAAA
ncbi:fetuin B [Salmo trutta]|uniref:Fetuin B n=1 Tax=Salmo trutta TaxID=8032 RepID=A0A674APJ8_SALTR|nr:histidine-rich glycoprotein-like [Salmo trutta]